MSKGREELMARINGIKATESWDQMVLRQAACSLGKRGNLTPDRLAQVDEIEKRVRLGKRN
jgi:hypothetical protein